MFLKRGEGKRAVQGKRQRVYLLWRTQIHCTHTQCTSADIHTRAPEQHSEAYAARHAFSTCSRERDGFDPHTYNHSDKERRVEPGLLCSSNDV